MASRHRLLRVALCGVISQSAGKIAERISQQRVEMATLDASATQTSGWHAPGWYLAHELVGDLLVPRTYAFYRYMRGVSTAPARTSPTDVAATSPRMWPRNRRLDARVLPGARGA